MFDLRDIPIGELVPHAGQMCLLDRALRADSECLVAEVQIGPQGLFVLDGVVGGWVGIELMAQAVAAWAGWQARQRGAAPPVGLLLGTRSYSSSVANLPMDLLDVSVRRVFQGDNGMAQFDCRIERAGQLLASAALTVFEPEDPVTLLQGRNDE